MNDASRAVLALTSTLVDAGVTPLKAPELWRLLDAVDDPGRLLGRTAAELAADLGDAVTGDRIAALLDSGVALAVRLDALHDQGIWTLTPFDAGYPSRLPTRLGPSAPPVLYGAGPPPSLSAAAVGIVGSAVGAGDGAIEVARSAAGGLAERGFGIVLGGVGGPDDLDGAALAAATAGAVAVLAGGLDRALARADLRRAVLAGRLCACTPYRPDAEVTQRAAAGRRKVLYGLSRITLVVAADAPDPPDAPGGDGSDTTGAFEALDRRHGPVAVWRGDGEGPGNDALERAGAIPVHDVAGLVELAATLDR